MSNPSDPKSPRCRSSAGEFWPASSTRETKGKPVSKTYEMKKGRNHIYGIESEEKPGMVKVLADCSHYNMVTFHVTTAQAEQLFDPNRKAHIQDIVPDLDKRAREMFITGTSPAEFDELFNGAALDPKEYDGLYADALKELEAS